MDGAIFRVRSEAKERMLKELSTIELPKNEVGGYAYNDANTLVADIERLLGEQLFEETTDVMKGLSSTSTNTLNSYRMSSSRRRQRQIASTRWHGEHKQFSQNLQPTPTPRRRRTG